MTYIVNDNCINCRHTDCVEVCPVDCFYIGENTIVIHPDECIDCGVCEPECPLDAIKADTDESVKDMDKWLLINKKFSAIWPNITKKQDPMLDHEKFKDIKDKHSKYFSASGRASIFIVILGQISDISLLYSNHSSAPGSVSD